MILFGVEHFRRFGYILRSASFRAVLVVFLRGFVWWFLVQLLNDNLKPDSQSQMAIHLSLSAKDLEFWALCFLIRLIICLVLILYKWNLHSRFQNAKIIIIIIIIIIIYITMALITKTVFRLEVMIIERSQFLQNRKGNKQAKVESLARKK